MAKPKVSAEQLKREIEFKNGNFYWLKNHLPLESRLLEFVDYNIPGVRIDGKFYRSDSILYYLKTGDWFHDFEYKDGDSNNLSLDNITPITIYHKPDSSRPIYEKRPTEALQKLSRSFRTISPSHKKSVQRWLPYTSENLGLDSENISISSQELSRDLLFDRGELFYKVTSDRIEGKINIDSVEHSQYAVLYFAVSGQWHEEIIVINSDIGLQFNNLLPYDFEIASIRTLDTRELNKWIECDPEDGQLYWRDNRKTNGLVNSILTDTEVEFMYQGTRLVNYLGTIYQASAFYAVFMGQYDLSDEMPNADNNLCDENSWGDPWEDDDRYGREKVIRCFYCGDDTQITRDHVIPVSSGTGKRSYNEKDTVPCCSECNTLLSNKWLTTVEDRACYLAERLSSRYGATLESFDYKEEEVNQFGPRLCSMIKANLFQKRYVMHRIDHCHKIAGSLYKPEAVSHLRGVTTQAKRTAYGIMDAFFFGPPMDVDAFVEQQALKLEEKPDVVLKILQQRLHVDVAIQFKFDHKFRLEYPLMTIWKTLKQA